MSDGVDDCCNVKVPCICLFLCFCHDELHVPIAGSSLVHNLIMSNEHLP